MKDILVSYIEEYKQHISFRGEDLNISVIKDLISEEKKLITEHQRIRYEINKRSSSSCSAEERQEIKGLKDKLKNIIESKSSIQKSLNDKIDFLPNILNYTTPIGDSESDNILLIAHEDCLSKEYKATNGLHQLSETNALYQEIKELLGALQQESLSGMVEECFISTWLNYVKFDLNIFFDELNKLKPLKNDKGYISIKHISDQYHCLYNYLFYRNKRDLACKLQKWYNLKYKKIEDYMLSENVKNTQSHDLIGQNMSILHMSKGASISGSRYVVMSDDLSELSRALGSFLLDLQKERGFREVKVPSIATDDSFYKAGQLPKFADQTFSVGGGRRLIPTAEVVLANIFNEDKLVPDEKLPIRLCSLSSCFRSEAGSLGRDTKGLIRVHEFEKVELFTYCSKEDEEEELDYILRSACKPLELLGIRYRVIALCSKDLGFHSSKTYDIEVWLPSQSRYVEISSCSSCHQFQSKRAHVKFKAKDGKKFLTTLNGSGLPITRLLAVFIETFYDSEKGVINIPESLRKYMGGKMFISKASKLC